MYLDLNNISLDEKSYRNILIYDIPNKNSYGAKLLGIRFDKVDGLIRKYDANKF